MLKLKLQYFGHLMRRTDSEDEMVGWYHQLNGHEFEQAPGDGEGQGNWCAAVRGVTKSQTMTEQLKDNSKYLRH